MSGRSKLLFLLLVIGQAAHSVEEYVTRLFEVFAPAELVSRLVSEDPAVGFAVANAAFVIVGVLCAVGPVRAGGRAGCLVTVAWLAIELANGIGHLSIAAWGGGYFPGSLTAVILVVTAACLSLSLFADRRRGVPLAVGKSPSTTA
jgi:hypothetical protein